MLAVAVVFLVAFFGRLVPVLRGGGLFGLSFYDDSVHYAAATGLVHGRLPYRDFLLLHPPGIVLALAPFALVGRLTSDPTGFALARLAFMALGGVNALLVSRFLRPVGTFAAWFGGLFYALFFPAVYSEHTVLLEALGNTCLLAALVLVSPVLRADRPSTRRLLLAGAFLGFATGVKIWGVVPVVVLGAWLLVRFGGKRAGWFVAGAAAACTAVCLPFFLVAPRTMWRMVVLDQLQRNATRVPAAERLNEIVGLSLYRPPDHWSVELVVALALLVTAAVGAWTQWRARPAVVLLVALVVLLLETPSWFLHYTALSAATVAITVGAGAQRLLRLSRPRSPRVRTVLAVLLVAGMLGFLFPVTIEKEGHRFPGPFFEAAVAARPGCVVADHPGPLILMDALSRNLRRGCRLVVDLGGASYDLRSPERGLVSRRKNDTFQRYAMSYLRSGNTVIFARFHRGFGLNNRSYDRVLSWPVLARGGGFGLRQPR